MIWNCGCCHHDKHQEYKPEKEYKGIWVQSTDTCDGCRDMCLNDKNCTGIECIMPNPTKRSNARMGGFKNCNLWKIKPTRKCETIDIKFITCWKEDKSKIHFIIMF